MILYRVITVDQKAWLVELETALYITNAIQADGFLQVRVRPDGPDDWTVAAAKIVAWRLEEHG